MKITSNQEQFDSKQDDFVEELVKTIRRTLEEQGLDEQLVYDLTSSLAFNVSALIDGCAVSGKKERPTVSYLAFRELEESLASVVISPVGSYLHEISEGFVESEFE